LCGEKEGTEGGSREALRSRAKKATRQAAQKARWRGFVRSRMDRIDRSIEGVIGSLRDTGSALDFLIPRSTD